MNDLKRTAGRPFLTEAQKDAHVAEILALKARGLSNKEIGALLRVTPTTVRNRLRRKPIIEGESA